VYSLMVLGERIEVKSPLTGVHQQRNIALAIAAVVELSNHNSYNISASQIADGIRKTQWPGRLERFSQLGRADVLLDVAHNPAGAWALRSALSNLHPEPLAMTAVFGCLRDKPIGEIAQILFPMFETVVLVEVDSPRKASLTEMEAAAAPTGVKVVTAENARDAIDRAYAAVPEAGLVVVTGSVYLVGCVRVILTESGR
jgi:dihydrofolate synthase/folylpolyglutamate synthase